MTCSPFLESRLPVGSSARSTSGFPTTARALEQRNDMLRTLGTMPADGRPAHSALTLPDSVPTR